MEQGKAQDRREAAVDFMNMIIGGLIDEAFRCYVDLAGRHHNAFFPAGAFRKKSKELWK